LSQYAQEPEGVQQIKEEFINEAELEIYPKLAPDRCDEWIEKGFLNPYRGSLFYIVN
jgi:hypothetical protein